MSAQRKREGEMSDTARKSLLSPGSHLGPYAITAKLGEGGMGEVWRATDGRLGREVALKLLPADFATDPERHARFEREAKVLASLNHPNIATLYGLEHLSVESPGLPAESAPSRPGVPSTGAPGAGGAPTEAAPQAVHVLVMELVEGEGLDARISERPVRIEEALPIALQVAEALEAAHERGIVHRDLKPANVKVRPDGTVKVLDFGLAKAWEEEVGGAELSLSPTITARHTKAGMILGTAAYMAPEQARGKSVDKRADIWGFGVVLFEMLTGHRLFEGEMVTDVLANVLKQEVDWDVLPASTPEALRGLLRRCLERNPKNRLRDIGEGRVAIEAILAGGARLEAGLEPGPSRRAEGASRPTRRETLAWAVAVLAILTAAFGLWFGLVLRAPEPPRVLRTTIELPPDLTVDPLNDSLALSPDGRTLAIAAADADGTPQIYLRALDGPAPRALDGTKGATYPTWSPDGRWLAFFADGKLKKIEIASGAVQTLADAPQGRGATWGPRGTIVFAPTLLGPLWKVSAGGGGASALEKDVPNGLSHRDPRFLPDGKSLLYVSLPTGPSAGGDQGLWALELDSGTSRRVLPDFSEGRFIPPGYLAFVRDGNLMVQPFDPGSLKLSGEALPVAQRVGFDQFRGTGQYAFAGGDLLVYQATSTGSLAQLTWFDPSGKELGTVGKPLEVTGLAISPSGRRAAALVGSPPQTRLWMIDLASGVASPFTFGDQTAFAPVWSPDGEDVVYGAISIKTGTGGAESLFVKKADGGSPPEQIAAVGTTYMFPTSWSPDGSVVAYTIQSPETKSFDLGVLSMKGKHELKIVVHGHANESGGLFSPDGKWLAYQSDESGSTQLYVVPYPGPGGKWQLSSNGTKAFVWASDHEIYNLSADGKVYAIELDTGPHGGLEIGSTRLMIANGPRATAAAYSRTLKRYLFAVPTGVDHKSPISLVTHWTRLLEPR
jgi:Tol biopolymer transport system component